MHTRLEPPARPIRIRGLYFQGLYFLMFFVVGLYEIGVMAFLNSAILAMIMLSQKL